MREFQWFLKKYLLVGASFRASWNLSIDIIHWIATPSAKARNDGSGEGRASNKEKDCHALCEGSQ